MDLIKVFTLPQLEIPFTEIKCEHIGSALYRYTMKLGEYDLKRLDYAPYGNRTKPIWHLSDRIINNAYIDDLLESKWEAEAKGKTVLVQ